MRIVKWTDHNLLRYFQKRSPNVLSKCSTCRVRRSSAGWQLWGAHCAWPEGDDTFAKNHLTSGVTDVQTGKSLPSAPCCLRNERGPPKKCRKSLEKNRNGSDLMPRHCGRSSRTRARFVVMDGDSPLGGEHRATHSWCGTRLCTWHLQNAINQRHPSKFN